MRSPKRVFAARVLATAMIHLAPCFVAALTVAELCDSSEPWNDLAETIRSRYPSLEIYEAERVHHVLAACGYVPRGALGLLHLAEALLRREAPNPCPVPG